MMLACQTKIESSEIGLAEQPSGGSVLMDFRSVISLSCAALLAAGEEEDMVLSDISQSNPQQRQRSTS